MFLQGISQFRLMKEIFNNISDMIFSISIDKDGAFVYQDANEAAIQKIQLPKNYIGQKIHDIMPKEIADIIVSNYKEAVTEKKETTFVAPYIDRLGHKRWFESKVTPIIGQNGDCEQIFTVTRDITKHKTEKKELSNAKREMELIFNHGADALFTFDEHGSYLKVNPGFTKLFGWTKEEIENDLTITILPKDKREEFVGIIEELKNGKVIENIVTECVAKNGNVITALASYSPMFEGGILVGGIAMFKDITQYKMMENLLKDSERRFRQIAEHTSDLIRVIDRECNILYASPSHEKILGLKANFFIGKSALSSVHVSDLKKVQDVIQIILKTKATHSVEFRRVTKQGKILWMDSVGTPILDANKEVQQIQFVSRDIGERKEKELRLKQLAFHDALTNLPNRRLFDSKLTKYMKKSFHQKKLMAVLVLDCDHFKSVNDTYGHDIGDKVIRHFADRIKSNIRDQDIVSRMGGDEFTAILYDLENEQDGMMIVQRIIDTMQVPFLVGDYKLKLTTSIGLTFYKGERKSKKLLLEEADTALYDAKLSGKNTFSIYENKQQKSRWKLFKQRVLKIKAR